MLDYWTLNNLVRPVDRLPPRLRPENAVRPWLHRPVPVNLPIPDGPPPPPALLPAAHWAPDSEDEALAQRVEDEIRELREQEQLLLVAPEEDFDMFDIHSPPPASPWAPDTDDEDLEREISQQRRRSAMDLSDEIAVGLAVLEDHDHYFGECYSVFRLFLFHFLHFFSFSFIFPGDDATPDPAERRRRSYQAAERRSRPSSAPQEDSDLEDSCPCPCHRRRVFHSSSVSGYDSPTPSLYSLSTVARSPSVSCEHDDSAYGGAYARDYSDGPDFSDVQSSLDTTEHFLLCPEEFEPLSDVELLSSPDDKENSDTDSVVITAVFTAADVARRNRRPLAHIN